MNCGQASDWRVRLYENKASELLLYGRALGLSHCEAEDVLHEVFVSLLKLDAQPALPEHYLVRSYRFRALNCRRGFWRRLAREFESIHWFERSEGETDRERAAMRCLSLLPVKQREAIVLKIWHGYTFEALGALLECSPNTVAARYRAGIEKIRSALKGEDYERIEFPGDADGFVETTAPVRSA